MNGKSYNKSKPTNKAAALAFALRGDYGVPHHSLPGVGAAPYHKGKI